MKRFMNCNLLYNKTRFNLMTALQIRQERAKVWAAILDLRGKRDATGKFSDATSETAFRTADAEYTRLTTEMHDADIHEAREKEMAGAAAVFQFSRAVFRAL